MVHTVVWSVDFRLCSRPSCGSLQRSPEPLAGVYRFQKKFTVSLPIRPTSNLGERPGVAFPDSLHRYDASYWAPIIESGYKNQISGSALARLKILFRSSGAEFAILTKLWLPVLSINTGSCIDPTLGRYTLHFLRPSACTDGPTNKKAVHKNTTKWVSFGKKFNKINSFMGLCAPP